MPVSAVETSAFERARTWVRRGERWGIYTLPRGKTVMEASYGPVSLWEPPKPVRMLLIQNLPMPIPGAGRQDGEIEYHDLYIWMSSRGLIKETFRPRKGSLWMLGSLSDDEMFEFKMRWL